MGDRYESLAMAAERAILERYSYLCIREEKVGIALRSLHDQASQVSTDEEFRQALKSSLCVISDSHIRIVSADGNSVSSYKHTPRSNYSREAVLPYLDDFTMSGSLIWGNIGRVYYISSESLLTTQEMHYQKMFNQECPDNEAFIVDLRGNSGGSDLFLEPLASALLGYGNPRISQYIRRRTCAADPKQLTGFLPLSIKPNQYSFGRRVAVLVGPETYSSAENTAMHLAAIPGAIVIGDITGGGSGCSQRHLLDGPRAGENVFNDRAMYGATFALELPSWLKYRRDKVLLESNGIVPDVLIPSEKTFDNNHDFVLESAIKHLR